MPTTLTTRRFNVEEYYLMADVGILDATERVELIEGDIVRMAAIGSRHQSCVDRLGRLLHRTVGERVSIRIQGPVRLGEISEPQPDVALVRLRDDDYASAHPGPLEVLLLVEVADTTTEFDREVKSPLYSGARVPEYWLVDLSADRIEVRREPGRKGYGRVTLHERGDALRPIAVPNVELAVDDVVPPRPQPQ